MNAAEWIAATLVSFLAATAIAAYAMDAIGFAIRPIAVLVIAVAVTAAVSITFRPADSADRAEMIAFAVIVCGVLAYLLWLAWPALLPLGSGPDLTHHLLLIDYIERNGRLPHDPQLGAVLGEMVNYTPGTHLLAAMAGAWTRTDGFHAVYPLVTLTVAIKAGLVFLIARRVLPGGAPRTPFAVAAVLLLFVPRDYFLDSFAESSYLAQVVSELFALAMWLAILVWSERPDPRTSAWIAFIGTAMFLAWPVWLGPLLLVWAAVLAFQSDLTTSPRLRHLAIATLPIAAVATLHALGRLHALAIAGVAGFVAYPTVSMFGWWFLLASAAGATAAVADRRSRSVALLLLAIALQSAALYVVAQRSGADRPYLALKMIYLAIYPLAIAGALAIATVARAFRAAIARGRGRPWSAPGAEQAPPLRPRAKFEWLAWAIVLVLAFFVARPLTKARPPKPVVSQPMFLAGQWARANLPRNCVDYLVSDDYSAYWLHVAVLGMARADERTRADDTFDRKAALVRWIHPEGLPYAIAEDLDALPRDIRTGVDVVQRFGPAAIVKRRGRSTCTER